MHSPKFQKSISFENDRVLVNQAQAFCFKRAKIWACPFMVSALPFSHTVWRAPFLIQLTFIVPVLVDAEWQLISSSSPQLLVRQVLSSLEGPPYPHDPQNSMSICLGIILIQLQQKLNYLNHQTTQQKHKVGDISLQDPISLLIVLLSNELRRTDKDRWKSMFLNKKNLFLFQVCRHLSLRYLY